MVDGSSNIEQETPIHVYVSSPNESSLVDISNHMQSPNARLSTLAPSSPARIHPM